MPASPNLDVNRLLAHYGTMARIRAFEDAAEQAHQQGHVKGAVHLSVGQEAVASGVCIHLTRRDVITTTHRGHGHTIAKGADTGGMMAELLGRASGTCRGKGGSLHIADFSVGMLGANGVVAAGISIAVGAAHAIRMRGEDRAAVCFFGDGAANRGPFLEGLNWAKIYDLPVLFVCEDNGFAAMTRTRAMSAGDGAHARAESLGIPARDVDGNDVMAVDETAGHLLGRIRSGAGPQFLLARTYRLKGHTASDLAGYRTAEEVEARRAGDPLKRAAEALTLAGVSSAVIERIERDADAEISAALAKALEAPWPAAELAWTDVQDLGSCR
jgi:acetoin:2,6-dichlorophenolindophenol oxidoreductase subunit alpha